MNARKSCVTPTGERPRYEPRLKLRCLTALAGWALFACLAAPVLAPKSAFADDAPLYTYETIDFEPSGTGTVLTGINNAGDIVGYAKTVTGIPGKSFVLRAGVQSPILPMHPYVLATGINNAGDIVGILGGEWFILKGSNVQTFRHPAPYGNIGGISDSGSVVGMYLLERWGNPQGFVYNGQSFSTINVPNAAGTAAFGINSVGDIVGGYNQDTANGIAGFAFRRTASGQFFDISYPNASYTDARGINSLGDVVGSVRMSYVDYKGFVFSKGKFALLEPPGSVTAVAYAINDLGIIVGGYTTLSPPYYHGFLAKPTTPPNPHPEGDATITLNGKAIETFSEPKVADIASGSAIVTEASGEAKLEGEFWVSSNVNTMMIKASAFLGSAAQGTSVSVTISSFDYSTGTWNEGDVGSVSCTTPEGQPRGCEESTEVAVNRAERYKWALLVIGPKFASGNIHLSTTEQVLNETQHSATCSIGILISGAFPRSIPRCPLDLSPKHDGEITSRDFVVSVSSKLLTAVFSDTGTNQTNSEHSEVIVNQIAQEPVAKIVLSSSPIAGRAALLDGHFSQSPRGLPLTFEWKLLSAPTNSKAVIGDHNLPVARLTPDIPGAYEIALTVKDDNGEATATAVINATALGDIDRNGTIDCADLLALSKALGAKTGEAKYDSNADLRQDGLINVRDLAFVSQKLPAGTRCP